MNIIKKIDLDFEHGTNYIELISHYIKIGIHLSHTHD